jgi:hypothetical protein
MEQESCTIENVIKPKLLHLMKNWNKRVVWQHAYFHFTNKRESELRKGELDWVKLLFNIFPNLGLVDYYAIATSYMLIVKEDFIKKADKLQLWYEAHFDLLLNEDVLSEIKKYYNKIKIKASV